jgi:hypothetical protein
MAEKNDCAQSARCDTKRTEQMSENQNQKRRTVSLGIRIDERIVNQLDLLAKKERRKRNWIIEQILGEKCGLETYSWKEEDLDD